MIKDKDIDQKCLLCQINDPDKKNTHLLTNSVMRPAISEPGRGNKPNSETYWHFTLGGGSTSVIPYIGRGTDPEKLQSLFGVDGIDDAIQNKADAFARDYVFCSECEIKFGFIESPYVRMSQKLLENPVAIVPNYNKDIEVLNFSDKYEKNLIYSFVMLNIWRYGIFNFTDERSIKILESLRLSLLQILDSSEELTKQKLAVTNIVPFYPTFIGYYKIADEKYSDDETNLKQTSTITYSSDKLNFFQFGLYTIIFQEHLSNFYTNAKSYFGLGSRIKIIDLVSVERQVKISLMNDDLRKLTLSNFIEEVIIPITKNDVKLLANAISNESGFTLNDLKFELIWEAYSKTVSFLNLPKASNELLIKKLVYKVEDFFRYR